MTIKRVALTFAKVLALLFVTAMVLSQVPELRYDFGPETPVVIAGPEDLAAYRHGRSTFASVQGLGDFDRAAVYGRHGIQFTYFLLKDYGPGLVVSTLDPVTDEWRTLDRHVGRLRAFGRMAFRRGVRAGFAQQFGVTIPDDALFLARDDVPRPSGWSIGATVFAAVLWCVLFYFFFVTPAARRPSSGARTSRR